MGEPGCACNQLSDDNVILSQATELRRRGREEVEKVAGGGRGRQGTTGQSMGSMVNKECFTRANKSFHDQYLIIIHNLHTTPFCHKNFF